MWRENELAKVRIVMEIECIKQCRSHGNLQKVGTKKDKITKNQTKQIVIRKYLSVVKYSNWK